MEEVLYNMKRTKQLIGFLLAAALLFTGVPVSAFEPPAKAEEILHNGYSDTENAYAIYPIPQSIYYSADGSFTEGSFTLGTNVSVVAEEGIDPYTQAFLDEILADYGRTKSASQTVGSGSQILLGIKGSGGAADTWAKDNVTVKDADLFEQTDAYLLYAKNGTIVILGKDADAAYYGLATLQMMFSSFNGNRFLNVQIEDFATMKMRGFIEGFYGGWNYKGRESLMRFGRDVKMNTYIYASKTDPYHTNDTLYPKDEIEQIEELVNIGKQTKVEYCWSIHIAYFFNYVARQGAPGSSAYETAFETYYNKLVEKFNQLYNVGVRKFAILNDDFGSGAHSEVVRLLNMLDDEFTAKGCYSFSYCMQGYNEAWSRPDELTALQDLNPEIGLFWTGANVNSPITQETVDFIKSKTNHEAIFWINYPVNEHAKSGLYLGDISRYVEDNVTGLTGAVSNPSRYTESNKVGLFQLGSLFWNNNGYKEKTVAIWEESFKYLQPEVYQSYLTIARNVAHCPGSRSDRVPEGFPESEYIKEALESVAAKLKSGQPISSDPDAQKLMTEFNRILEAIPEFRGKCKNEALVTEMDSWLKSLNDVATAGKTALSAILAVEANDVDSAWKNLGLASAAMSTQNTYPSYDGNMALAGSRRLVPFINQAILAAKNNIIPYINPSYEVPLVLSPYARIHGTEQSDSAEFSKMLDNDSATAASFTSGKQREGDYFGVDLGKTVPLQNIEILQAQSDSDNNFYHNAVLEYSITGNDGDWTSILEYTDDQAPRRITVSEETLSGISAKYIRLRLTKEGTPGKPDYWTFIRDFTVNKSAETPAFSLFASESVPDTITVTKHNLTFSITDESSVSLAPGEYIGIKLDNLYGIQHVDVPNAASGLTLQYSENGILWKDMPAGQTDIGACYIRLYNQSGGSVSFSPEGFAVTVYAAAIHPFVLEYSAEFTNLNASENSGPWSSLFDGNRETYIWTDAAQKAGQYILIDLGYDAPLYDITITQGGGTNPNPKFYNAEFSLSSDKNTWRSIGTISDTNGITATGVTRTEADGYITISRTDLNGEPARYLKIELTKDSGYKLRINEIEFNKTVETSQNNVSKITGTNLAGNLNHIIDGDITTVYTSDQESDGTASIKYTLTENTRLTSATFLQNAADITNAEVKALVYDGQTTKEEIVGKLINGSTTFYFDGKKDILSLTVTWPEGSTPSLYEIFTNTGESVHTLSLYNDNKLVQTYVCVEDKTLLLPESIPTKVGYAFKGWSDGTNTYDAGSRFKMGTSDVTLKALWEKTGSLPPEGDVIKNPGIQENKTYSYNGLEYKVTSLSAATVEVAVQKNAALTKIIVPDAITLNGKSYKVTSVAASAFKNFKQATSAVIGKNVETIGDSSFAGCVKLKKVTLKSSKLRSIGKKAFQKCKALKNIIIKSKSLKTVGKNAFKGIHKKAVIKVPAAKYKDYVKRLSKKGQSGSVKIKK